MSKFFPIEEAKEIAGGWIKDPPLEKVEEEIIDQSRWETFYRGIFKDPETDKFYSVEWCLGSTEMQEDEWFYTDPVEFKEVVPREVTVVEYVPVADATLDSTD